MFTFDIAKLHIEYDPQSCRFSATTPAGTVWKWGNLPYILFSDNKAVTFDGHCIETAAYKTGVGEGLRAVYGGFEEAPELKVHTLMWVNYDTSELCFESRVENEAYLQVSQLHFPAPFEFGAKAGEGYTILPRMQGTLIPAGQRIKIANGMIMERDGYMPFFGQVRLGSGYIGIYETPYDARYFLPEDMVAPYFVESMGTIRYKRKMLYRFIDGGCDYVKLAKEYRSYVINRGKFVSLEEKIARNPNIAKLIGTPIIHTGIATQISEKSAFYRPDDPDYNNRYTKFSTRAEQLRKLHENGLERAYIHLDGWGKAGYDNLHPDVFPPHQAAGGAEGMKALADTCSELGYMFGIHDQYRDYYYDAESFDIANAALYADGSTMYCSVWNGGPQTVLCATLAPDYVQRNYDEFEKLGIKLAGSYLDVFSVVELDECVNPDHPMTREECVGWRGRCFDILMSKGIIPSSEETVDCMLPYIALCHHAPFYTTDFEHGDAVGIPIPLFNLVYHDAVIIPWFGHKGQRGGWGIPNNDNPFIHGILNGGTAYCGIDYDKEELEFMRPALELHSRVAKLEMVSHEFLDDSMRRQRTVFADGTSVEVDFDTDEYSIKY